MDHITEVTEEPTGHETVTPENILVLQQIEAAKAENQALLDRIEAEKAWLAENRDEALSAVAQAQARVEEARAAFSEDIAALKAELLETKDHLTEGLTIAADDIIAAVPWEQQWATYILGDSKERILSSIDEAVAEFDGLAAWVRPRPVDEDEIRRVIERDLKTLADEQALKE
jgi:hypothetical protein